MITLFVILVLSVITGKRVEGLTSKNPVTHPNHRPPVVVGDHLSKSTGGPDSDNRQ